MTAEIVPQEKGALTEKADGRSHVPTPLEEMAAHYANNSLVQRDLLRWMEPAKELPKDPDATQQYLCDIGRFRMLEEGEENELSVRVQSGIKAWKELKAGEGRENRSLEERVIDGVCAYRGLYVTNLRFAVWVAKKYQGGGHSLSLLDLIQYGNEGLSRAIELFDPERGVRFTTYSLWWIKQRIRKGLNESARTVRLPANTPDTYQRMKKIIELYRDEVGGEPTNEEVLKIAEVSKKTLTGINTFIDWHLMSLNQPIGEDGDTELIDFVAETKPSPDDELIAVQDGEERRNDLFSLLENSYLLEEEAIALGLNFAIVLPHVPPELILGDRQSTYADAVRFMEEKGKALSLNEIGQFYGVSRERIRQKVTTARLKIHKRQILEKINEICLMNDEEGEILTRYFAGYSTRGRSTNKSREEARATLSILELCFGERLEASILTVLEPHLANLEEDRRQQIANYFFKRFGLQNGNLPGYNALREVVKGWENYKIHAIELDILKSLLEQ